MNLTQSLTYLHQGSPRPDPNILQLRQHSLFCKHVCAVAVAVVVITHKFVHMQTFQKPSRSLCRPDINGLPATVYFTSQHVITCCLVV